MAQSVTAIRRLCRHYALKSVAFRFLVIHIEEWRVNAQSIARQSGQTFNIKRRACLRIFPNPGNMISPKDKNVAAMRLNKVVGKFVNKHLVACVDCASGNDLTAVINATRKNVEIMTERVGWRIHEKVLPLTDHSRKSKKEEDFFWRDLENLIILTRDHVDVVATQNNEVADLSQNIGRRFCAGMTNDPV